MLKKLFQSVGLSSLILVMNYGDLLGGGSDVRMHVPFALRGIIMAQVADILLLGLLIFAVVMAFKRTRFNNWILLVIAVVIPPYLIERTAALDPAIIRDNLVLITAVWIVLVLLLFLKFKRFYRYLLRAGDAIGIFFAAFAITSIVQLLFVATWKPGPQQHSAAWMTASQPPRLHPLIVWVVFDELSYEQVFGHRAHDLELPSFDALRNQSTVFTNVQPIGYKTVTIIPSLLTGKVVDHYRYKFDNRFLVHYQNERGWQPLKGGGTIFHDAQQSGWRTAAVGWYNPYCGIYGDAIDNCYWMNLDRIDGLMSQRDNFWRNTYSPLQQVVREIKAPARADRDACNYDVRQRAKTHHDLQDHALELLKTDQADFVFIHMDVPHSPNIWSRIDEDYIDHCDSSYLDNLELADHLLGSMMTTLQASPRWKDTTVIVEGDHGWRVDLWNWFPAWTDEDDDASHGTFDPRPELLIHHAGQTQAQVNATSWSLLNVHDAVEQVLKGQ